LEKLGLTVTRVDGDELYTHCPAHEALLGKADRTPSFSVNSESGLCFCFSCHYGGSWVKFAADMLDATEGEAVAWTRAQGTLGASKRRLERLKAEHDQVVPVVSRAALALCEPPTPQMLAGRRITAEAAAAFGVLREGAAWILPIRATDGRLMGWQVKDGGYVRNRPADVVLKGASIFGVHLPPRPVVVAVESPLDAVRIHGLDWDRFGVPAPAVRAVFGSKASDVQVDLLAASGERVIAFHDHDPAGWSMAKAMYAALRARGRLMLTVTYDGLPRDVDPGDLSDEQIVAQISAAVSPLRRRWRC
jgi:hypothetical protein